MKYIRTKDNKIWKVLKEDSISFIVDDTHTPSPFDVYTVLKTEVVKQADTIEELCDKFVITEHGTDANFLMEDFDDVKEYFIGNSVVYGAIWTNKGLIYVAKMNDKGELELL